MRVWDKQGRQEGNVKIDSKQTVDYKKENLPQLKSDDPDLIALALVSETKLLVSGDKDFHRDFKSIARGKVYQKKKKHLHLLENLTCN